MSEVTPVPNPATSCLDKRFGRALPSFRVRSLTSLELELIALGHLSPSNSLTQALMPIEPTAAVRHSSWVSLGNLLHGEGASRDHPIGGQILVTREGARSVDVLADEPGLTLRHVLGSNAAPERQRRLSFHRWKRPNPSGTRGRHSRRTARFSAHSATSTSP